MKPANAEAIFLRYVRGEICAAVERSCVKRGLLSARIGNVTFPYHVNVAWLNTDRREVVLHRARAAADYLVGEAFSSVPDGVGARLVFDACSDDAKPREVVVRWKLEPLERSLIE